VADVDLELRLVDEATFEGIPEPIRPGARCRTCDYWERLDGTRDAPDPAAGGTQAARASEELKRSRLLTGRALAGSYAMLAFSARHGEGPALGFAQFGPISHYPRAQSIRDRYPDLPDSPAPWVVTCLQAPGGTTPDDRLLIGAVLLAGVRDELERRGIAAVEAYPEGVADPWLPSPGPAALYEADGWTRVAGDDRVPVYRRELEGTGAAIGWDDMLTRVRPADDDAWPIPTRPTGDPDDFFRLPPERPKRPNPFGED
jgi:hypothetical protein